MNADAGDFVFIPAVVLHHRTSQSEPLVAVIARTDPNEQESIKLIQIRGAIE
jgi:uncharacterized RmlC-like cupin family protein